MTRRTPLARAAASLVLAGALLAGTAGCTFISQQATLIHYDPSDGVSAAFGPVKLSNVVAIADESGKALSLLVTFTNTGSKSVDVSLQYLSDGEKDGGTVSLEPNSSVSFGNSADQKQIVVLKPGVVPGGLFPVYVQAGDEPGKQLMVPVLNTNLGQYSTLGPVVPTPTPTPTPVATILPVPEPTDTPAP